MNCSVIRKGVEELTRKANFFLRPDILRALKKSYRKEKNKFSKKALSWILENSKIAGRESIALCQDTGIPIVFLEAGRKINVTASLIKSIEEGVKNGYRNNYLRKSSVDPFKRINPSYNNVITHIEFSPKVRGLKITVLPKGFGSENKSSLKMFNPTVDLNDIEKFVLESVKKAGPEACPPFIIGIGIGATADKALLLSKKSLIENIDNPSADKELCNMEKQLLKKINLLKIGAMGLGGNITCLAVKIKIAPTHIAGLPVGLSISCHSLRSASKTFGLK